MLSIYTTLDVKQLISNVTRCKFTFCCKYTISVYFQTFNVKLQWYNLVNSHSKIWFLQGGLDWCPTPIFLLLCRSKEDSRLWKKKLFFGQSLTFRGWNHPLYIFKTFTLLKAKSYFLFIVIMQNYCNWCCVTILNSVVKTLTI